MPVPHRLVQGLVEGLVEGLASDALDLLLGRACLRCAALGPALCHACLATLRGHARLVPPPAGLPVVASALPYDDAGRRLVLAYKEHGTRSLAPMLGVLLADAVLTALAASGGRRALLVPVPQHRRAPRGFDALGAIVVGAVRTLHDAGYPVERAHLLRTADAHRPLKSLGRAAREQAVAGAFRPDPGAAGRSPRMPVIVVDDVLTTGATACEATRTLVTAGVPVHGAAVVAAASRDTWARSRGPARTTNRP